MFATQTTAGSALAFILLAPSLASCTAQLQLLRPPCDMVLFKAKGKQQPLRSNVHRDSEVHVVGDDHGGGNACYRCHHSSDISPE